MDKIRKLSLAQIRMNAQIVLVPQVNDGEELQRTICDLATAYPSMNSVAVVPIGITKHRQGLYPVKIYDEKSSKKVIHQVHQMQQTFLRKLGTRFVFLSDEFYVMAKQFRPSEEEYEGYIQLENGVGLMTKMEDEFRRFLSSLAPKKLSKSVSIATGTSAYSFICSLSEILMRKFDGLRINVYAIRNDFFGETITVAGLLTAQDILSQLRGQDLGEKLLLPRVMMKADEDVFLDDMSIEEFERRLGIAVIISEIDGELFIRNIVD